MSDGPRPAAAGAGTVTIVGCVQADVVLGGVTDLPAPGTTRLADAMSLRVGGAGANAALAFTQTGSTAQLRLIGCVGDDDLGGWMRRELARAGIADELSVLDGGQSGLTVALESPARDRTFLTYLGVNADWSPNTIPADATDCDHLLLCDYFVAPRLQGDAARALLGTARDRGAVTYFDTAGDPHGFGPAVRREIRELLALVDVFLPNEDEVRALAGVGSDGDAAAAAQALRESVSGDGPGWIVVKLGARGCLAIGPDGRELLVPAPEIVAADTTGAGDAFNAGLIAARAAGEPWTRALAAASRFASEIVARPSHSRWRDLDRGALG